MLDDKNRIKIEAGAFRRLLQHLRQRVDVQNMDMMNLAGFCRTCLANWMRDEAALKGVALDEDAARLHVDVMPFAEWKALHQKDASAEQQAKFAAEMAKLKSH